MAETTADVRRDIELTRERMSDTLAQLERKLNVMETIREHPWPSLAVAAGAGLLLAGSRADKKTVAATAAATAGMSNRVGSMLDDLVSRLVSNVSEAIGEQMDNWVNEFKEAILHPPTRHEQPSTDVVFDERAPTSAEPRAARTEAMGAYGNRSASRTSSTGSLAR